MVNADPALPATDRTPIAIQKAMGDPEGRAFGKYQDLVVGSRSLWRLLQLRARHHPDLVGAGGSRALLRGWAYPWLLGRVGQGVVFGQGVVLRHPRKIELGDGVVIDDLVVLDAKGTNNRGIRIGDGVFLGRGTILSCKDGDIVLGDHTNIGFHSEVFSGSSVTVGRHGLFAAYTYLVGGGHEFERTGAPVLEQARTSAGITLGDDVWLGAGAKVLDGVRIGSRVAVGAGAVVTRDLPDGVVAVGVPARVVRERGLGATGSGE